MGAALSGHANCVLETSAAPANAPCNILRLEMGVIGNGLQSRKKFEIGLYAKFFSCDNDRSDWSDSLRFC
jgi:hypothetical protein